MRQKARRTVLWPITARRGAWIAAAAAVLLAGAGVAFFFKGVEDSAVIENLVVLEDLEAGQAGAGIELVEVGQELLRLLDEESDAGDNNNNFNSTEQLLDVLESALEESGQGG